MGHGLGHSGKDTVDDVDGFDIATGEQGSNNGRIGIAAGYTRAKLAIEDRASTAKAKTIHLLGYAGGAYDAIRVRAGVGYAWADTRTGRFVAFPGFADRLRGAHDGDTFHSFAEARYAIPLSGGTVRSGAPRAYRRVYGNRWSDRVIVAARTEFFAFVSAGLRHDTSIVEGLLAGGVTA